MPQEAQPFTRFDHVQLAMPPGGENVARDFYTGVLGMTEVRKPARLTARGGTWFQSGDLALHLGVDPDFKPARKAHPALRCRNYLRLLERLRSASISVEPDAPLSDGSEHAYVSDPFGNRIELIADDKS